MPNKTKKRSLFTFVFPAFLALTLVAMLAVAFAAWTGVRQYSESQVQTRLEQNTSFLLRYLVNNGEDNFADIASHLRHQTDLRVTLIDTMGLVHYDSDEDPGIMDNHRYRPEIEGAIVHGEGQALRYSHTIERDMFYYARRVENKAGDVIWVLRMALPVVIWKEGLYEIRGPFLGSFALILVLAIVLAYWISRRIILQLQFLQESSKAYARQEMIQTFPEFSWREFHSVARALHQMAGQLHKRIKEEEHQKTEKDAILSSLAEGLVALDATGKILWANKVFSEFFPEYEAWLGDKANKGRETRLLSVLRHSGLGNMLERLWSSNKAQEEDLQFTRPGRELQIMRVRTAPMLDEEGELFGVLFSFSDVSRIKKLEQMRQEFVANVSHELRTPITSIQGAVETMETMEELQEGPQERFLAMISRHSRRMKAIVTDLLSLSHLDTEDSAQLEKNSMRVEELFHRVGDSCHSLAENKQIKIHYECESDLQIYISESLMEQAIINLVSNGIRYSDAGKTITLQASVSALNIQNKEELCIDVIDQGWGIPKEHLERVFERFYRVDKARSREMGGTGLGLALTRHIILLHNGRIEVTSELGQGSTFRIFLPYSS